MNEIDLLVQYAMQFVGKPYIWGGDDSTGWDCSGLVLELLRMRGKFPPTGDTTAQGLFNMYYKAGQGRTGQAFPGYLAFYGADEQHVTHVGMCLSTTSMIEAGGGGRTTTTPEAAAQQNAYVRIRPIKQRKDLLAVLIA